MKLLNDLIKIQDRLSKTIPNFPKSCCSLSSKEVYDKLGLAPVSGFVLTSSGIEKHSWNKDSEGNVVDLTLHQFEDFKFNSLIYLPFDEAVHKYGYVENEEMTANLILYAKNINNPLSCVFRSEEHTSELQSHVNLVCRLLL